LLQSYFVPLPHTKNAIKHMKLSLLKLFFAFCFFTTNVLSTALSQTQSNNTMNNTANNSFYPDKVHNMSMLSQYKVFKGNALIKYAFIISENYIEIILNDSYKPHNNNVKIFTYNYDVQDAEGRFLLNKVDEKVFETEGQKLLIKNVILDLTKNYLIELDGEMVNLYLHPAIGGILDTYFDASGVKDLGVTYSGTSAMFKLWSPPAGKVELVLFDKTERKIEPLKPLLMQNTGKGVWELSLKTSDLKGVTTLDGLFYQYKVFAYGDIKSALDPYAKSMAAFDTSCVDNIGKAAIVNMNDVKSKPASFNRTYSNAKFMANETDMVAYEIHVRDFTIQPDIIEPEEAGTFIGFTRKIDHLKNLGITHVQLLPVQNFYTVNENDREYKRSNALKGNYNWGYDPHNYFTVEGWFAKDAQNPYARIKEFREMVHALHNKGIGVIMDVVYNHAYTVETFENVAPGCYYRFDENFNISGVTGAGPTIESRRVMVRKLIIESLIHFVKEYHIDGFRFDLLCFTDHQTVELIRNEVGKAYNALNFNELILQGEAWMFSDLDLDVNAKGADAATTKLNYPEKKINLAFFNDSSRDAYTGREQNKGFVQGIYKEADRVATGIIAGLKDYNAGNKAINSEIFNDAYNRFADAPSTCLNYLTIHDGFTLWDKINLSVSDISKVERARIMRMASAMLFTSQGKLILHGGDEMLRTKPLSLVDKESHRAHTTEFADEEEGTLYFHENTYCSHDYTNMLRWDRLMNEYYEFSSGMIDYYKGLINMRRQLPCLRFSKTESIQNGLVFLGADAQGGKSGSYFSGFGDEKLQQLEIKFVNGPAYERYYIAGEVYPTNLPANFETPQMFYVDFDGEGVGSAFFTKDQINAFDLSKWGEGATLNIKLVKTPGQWDALPTAYTGMGNNVIKAGGINNNGKSIIDLSITDYAAGEVPRSFEPYIAYWLDNTLEKDLAKGFTGTSFTQLIVVHNAAEESINVEANYIENASDWVVICDAHNAGVKPLKYLATSTEKKGETNVLIEQGNIVVPRKSTAVIAKIK